MDFSLDHVSLVVPGRFCCPVWKQFYREVFVCLFVWNTFCAQFYCSKFKKQNQKHTKNSKTTKQKQKTFKKKTRKQTKKTGKEKKTNQTGLKSGSEQEGGSLSPPTFTRAQGVVSTASPPNSNCLFCPSSPAMGSQEL